MGGTAVVIERAVVTWPGQECWMPSCSSVPLHAEHNSLMNGCGFPRAMNAVMLHSCTSTEPLVNCMLTYRSDVTSSCAISKCGP